MLSCLHRLVRIHTCRGGQWQWHQRKVFHRREPHQRWHRGGRLHKHLRSSCNLGWGQHRLAQGSSLSKASNRWWWVLLNRGRLLRNRGGEFIIEHLQRIVPQGTWCILLRILPCDLHRRPIHIADPTGISGRASPSCRSHLFRHTSCHQGQLGVWLRRQRSWGWPKPTEPSRHLHSHSQR